MTYAVLKLIHIIGVILIGAGLLGVWISDNIAVFYDGLVVPGALLLLASGAWLIVDFFGGWGFLNAPWLAGMVVLFVFTPQLQRARAEAVPTFTHFLDLPILFVIVSLGTLKPDTWTLFAVGLAVAIAVAAALTILVPRLYPWTPQQPTG